jgi:hypothetical protein
MDAVIPRYEEFRRRPTQTHHAAPESLSRLFCQSQAMRPGFHKPSSRADTGVLRYVGRHIIISPALE